MISVIIATFNGELVLSKTLHALSLLEIPSKGVEFIVVNNSSTDNTANILLEYTDRLHLQVLQEPRQGKSFAIHKGLKHAKGDLIVFTDDDVIPDKHWLVAFERAAYEQPGSSVFLGQIRPYWVSKPPNWLVQLTDEGKACGCTNKVIESGPAIESWAKGANFCIRKEVLDYVSFREDLWIAGENCVGGEDTDFVKKAAENGFKLSFVSEACLKHIIRPYEMSIRGVWQRYFRIGRSMANLDINLVKNERRIFGYPRWVIVQLVKLSMKLLKNFFMGKKYKTMCILIQMATIYGQAYQNKYFQSVRN